MSSVTMYEIRKMEEQKQRVIIRHECEECYGEICPNDEYCPVCGAATEIRQGVLDLKGGQDDKSRSD